MNSKWKICLSLSLLLRASYSFSQVWTTTNNYPINVTGDSCVANNNYVYCVGGYDVGVATNAVYYSELGSSYTWVNTTPYPINVFGLSCSTTDNNIYCVGGSNGNTNVDLFYYAVLYSTGVGNWNIGPTYPESVNNESCVTGDNLYCVGGFSTTNNIVYSTLTVNGIGVWESTTTYPAGQYTQCISSTNTYCITNNGIQVSYPLINYPSSSYSSSDCSINGDIVYCQLLDSYVYTVIANPWFGAWTSTTTFEQGTPFSIVNNTLYYLTSGGIASKNPAIETPYPNCEFFNNIIYCESNFEKAPISDAYYINISSMASWVETTDYPEPIEAQSCNILAGNMFCIGGYNGAYISSSTYYSTLSNGITSWSEGPAYPLPIFSTSCNSISNNEYCVAGASGTLTSAVYTSDDFAAWTSTPAYPTATFNLNCVSNNSNIYCINNTNSAELVP